MTQYQAIIAAPAARVRDLIDLGKPRLSMLVLFTAATGLWLAPHPPGIARSLIFLVATSCLVAAANALNCLLEREIDAAMRRTRDRPLPAGRLEPWTALAAGLTVGAGALVVLAVATNTLTTWLGAIALLTYVLVYTPLKRVTPWALPVGAIPGAIPPLMGWTAATGSLGLPGWYVFGVLFAWQLPHFAAIALYLEDDYRRGGIRALPVALGRSVTVAWLRAFTVAMVAYSLLPWWLGLAGAIYTAGAAALGAGFLWLAFRPVSDGGHDAWARRVFGYTLLYLPLLVALLVVNAR